MPPGPLQQTSRAAVAALLAEAHPDEAFSPGGLERVLLGNPSYDPDLCLEETASGLLVAAAAGAARAGALFNPCAASGGVAGFVKLLVVAAGARARGIGGALLLELEERLRARGAERLFVDGAAPAYLRPGLDARDRGALAFLKRRGYRETGERQSLVMSTAESSTSTSTSTRTSTSASTSTEIELRRAVAGDRARLDEIEELFSPEWAYEARLALRVEPPGLHLALAGARIVGFAASGVAAPDIFGPIGVAPEQRGRGLGVALYRRALADIGARGCERALISWIGPVELYRRLGTILETRRYVVLEKQL